jgi:DNA-binding transcriptional regulator GbsR (MarR family)
VPIKDDLNKKDKLQSEVHSKSTQKEIEKLQALSDSVGDFIRYWGFRRIHGQIWTQVFLSKESLSGAELTERLGVSKALVSPALAELESYGLIEMVQDGKKTKRYSAVPDVVSVIKKILKERELKIIKTAQAKFESLSHLHKKSEQGQSVIDGERLEEVGQMIALADFSLGFLIGQSNEEALQYWSEEAQKNLEDL